MTMTHTHTHTHTHARIKNTHTSTKSAVYIKYVHICTVLGNITETEVRNTIPNVV